MNILTELIVRSVLVIALNDGIILYVINKRSTPLTLRLVVEIILVTSIAMGINIWYCLYRRGMI